MNIRNGTITTYRNYQAKRGLLARFARYLLKYHRPKRTAWAERLRDLGWSYESVTRPLDKADSTFFVMDIQS